MSNKPSKGIAALLAYFPLTGIFGMDKFYAGATNTGIIQLVLSLTLIGLIITCPWACISASVLVIAILWGGSPFLYPNVEWAPDTQTDKIIAWIIVALSVLTVAVRIVQANKVTK